VRCRRRSSTYWWQLEMRRHLSICYLHLKATVMATERMQMGRLFRTPMLQT
jgi:hypothetical protein